jgi:hypothetical protein
MTAGTKGSRGSSTGAAGPSTATILFSALGFWTAAAHWSTRRFILSGRILGVNNRPGSLWRIPNMTLLQQTQLPPGRWNETSLARSGHEVCLSFSDKNSDVLRKVNWLRMAKPNSPVEVHVQQYAASLPWRRNTSLVVREIHVL